MIDLIIGIANKVLVDACVRDQINVAVQWDEDRCEISPGGLACALILTIFFSSARRSARWTIGTVIARWIYGLCFYGAVQRRG